MFFQRLDLRFVKADGAIGRLLSGDRQWRQFVLEWKSTSVRMIMPAKTAARMKQESVCVREEVQKNGNCLLRQIGLVLRNLARAHRSGKGVNDPHNMARMAGNL